MGAGGGATVAAIAAVRKRRRREILDAFRLADATAPERARTIESLGLAGNRELDHFIEERLIVPGSRAGSMYLDESAWVAHRDASSSRQMRIIAAAVLFLLALGAALLVNLVGGSQ